MSTISEWDRVYRKAFGHKKAFSYVFRDEPLFSSTLSVPQCVPRIFESGVLPDALHACYHRIIVV